MKKDSDVSMFANLLGLPQATKVLNLAEIPEGAVIIAMKYEGKTYSLGFNISDSASSNIQMLNQLRRITEETIVKVVHEKRQDASLFQMPWDVSS